MLKKGMAGRKVMTRKEYERLRKSKEDEERVRQNRLRLEREAAKEQWVEEFLMPVDEFTMEAYHEFLADETNLDDAEDRREERDQLVEKYFGNALDEKEERARRSITLRKVARAANELWKSTKKEAAKVGHEVMALLEPYEKKVERRVSESLRRIAATDKETEDFLAHRQHMLELLDQQAKTDKVKSRRTKKALELHEFSTDMVKKDEDRVRQEMRKKRLEQFKAQVKAETEARVFARRAEEEAKRKEEAEAVLRVRKWRLQHWTKVAVEARSEAQELRVAVADSSQRRMEDAATADDVEEETRMLDREEEQVTGPATSTDAHLPGGGRLGVFGIPVGEGEFRAHRGGGHKPGADDATVQLFQPTQQYEQERKVWPLWEAQAAEERKRRLYEQLQSEASQLGEQAELLEETRKRVARDLDQQRQEDRMLQWSLEKPGQRYADKGEKEEMHARKTHIKTLERRLQGLEKEAAEVGERREGMQAQALGLAKEVAVLKERNREEKERLEAEATQGGAIPQLPVVVGRSIAKVPEIGGFVGRPSEAYHMVTQQSRLEVIKEQSKAVFKAQRDAHSYDMKVWVGSEERRLNRDVLEELLSRLRDAQDKVKSQSLDNVKADLVTALQLFFASKDKLVHVETEVRGGVTWWASRSERDCRHVEQWWSSEEAREDREKGLLMDEEKIEDGDPEAPAKRSRLPSMQAVCLSGGAKTGVVMGVFDFPKLDHWTVQFLVSKRDPRLADQGSPMDSVTIRLGPTVRSLSFVGTYYNVVNEDTLSIQYEVGYQLKARSLAYRFEFTSASPDVNLHMTVLPAVFVNKPAQELEECDGNRVLSALVRYLRVEMAKGVSLRTEKLLEELVSAESVTPDLPAKEADKARATRLAATLRRTQTQTQTMKGSRTLSQASVEKGGEGKWQVVAGGARAANGKGKLASSRFYDSEVIVGYKQRYVREAFIHRVRTELERLKEADGKANVRPILANRELTKLTGQERRELRSLKSLNAYIKRKRALHQELVDAARVLKGRHLSVYDEATKTWEHIEVIAVRVKWRDMVDPDVTCLVQAYNEWDEAVGGPQVRDLSGQRFHELERGAAVDEEAYKQLAEQRKKAAANAAMAGKNEERKKSEQELAARVQVEGEHELERVRRKKLEDAKRQIEAEADRKLADRSFTEKLEVLVLAVVEEMRTGLFKTKDNTPYTRPSERDAREEAYRRWRAEFVAKTTAKTEEDLLYQEQVQREKMEHRLRKMERRRKRREAKQARRAAELVAEQEALRRHRLNELAHERMAMLKRVLQIPNFERAVTGGPDWPFCEHLRAKAWGGLYGKGLRCMRCRKELTTTHEDPAQQAGIGSGEDPELVGMLIRHRQNSPAFRFKNGQELRRVEEERRRLEKERRAMQEVESTFYDLEDMKVIYDFDRRHKSSLKEQGVFRQGVQWTNRELTAWQRKQTEELEALTPRSRHAARKELQQALVEREPPPTLRQYDHVRRALHQDLLYSFARVNNCRARGADLRAHRVIVLLQRKEAGAQAEYVHEKLATLETALHRLEKTLDDADTLIELRKRTDRQWHEAKALVVLAQVEEKEAHLSCVGVEDEVDKAQGVLSRATEEVDVLLRRKVLLERESKRLQGNVDLLKARAAELRAEMQREEDKVSVMMYRKRGEILPTPYGRGSRATVWHYREEDDMVLCKLKMGKLYMPPYRSVLMDRASQQAARVEMEVEESLCRRYYADEKAACKAERLGMEDEERHMLAVLRLEREEAEQVRVIDESVREEEALVLAMLGTEEGMVAINERADKIVSDAANKRQEERRAFEGPVAQRPQPLTRKEKDEMRAVAVLKLKADFLTDRKLVRRQVTTNLLEARRKERAEMQALVSTFDELTHELIEEVVGEEMRRGLEARMRAQAESRIVFLDPPHMTYAIYSRLKARWVERRVHLRRSIDLLLSRVSKSSEEFSAEAEKAKRLNESLEGRAAREVEEARQAKANAEMAAEETVLRAFYREEFLINLRERRQMAQEERYMRMYLLMLQKLGEAEGQEREENKAREHLSRNELRRLELKKGAASKIREEKEGLQMMQEDEAAFELRAHFKMLEQRAKLLAEGRLVLFDDSDDEEDDVSVVMDEEEDAEVIAILPPPIAELSAEDKEQLVKDGETVEEIEAAVKARLKEIKQRRRHVRMLVEANRGRKASERSAAAKWSMLYETSLVKSMRAELAWMEASEEEKSIEFDLRAHSESLHKLHNLSLRKGLEEVRAKQELRTRTEIAQVTLKARDEAVLWAEKCRENEAKRRAVRHRVQQDTRYKDTDVIAGFYQRWPTEALCRRLYMDYFRTLALILATRCEVIGLERRLMKMQDYLVRNLEEIGAKTTLQRSLNATIRRKIMRKWRRSELGTRLFPRTRRRVLSTFFRGWVRFQLWQQGFQKAFELKYTTIKHELDLRRLYPETRSASERAEHGTTTDESPSNPEETPITSDGVVQGQAPYVKRTLLQRHKLRTLRCRHCRGFYIEDQNQDTACHYHPGEYKIACPKSCPGLSIKCMSHRMKRWTCCDVRDEARHMANGCRQRRHMAEENTAPYEAYETAAKASFDERDKALDAELNQLCGGDWDRQLLTAARLQLRTVEAGLVQQRATAARYDNIKFE